MPEKPRNDEGLMDAGGTISRRQMLKRVGAGAAIAWSAPILSSLRTPAFAQDRGTPCGPCAGDFCLGQSICGTNDIPPFFICGCAQPVGQEGGSVCFCYQDDFCVNRTKCSSQADCPGGQVCLHTCCDASVGSPVCFPPCGTTPSAQAQGQGPHGLPD